MKTIKTKEPTVISPRPSNVRVPSEEYVDKSTEAGADPEHLCANWERGCNGTTAGPVDGFLDLCDNCRLGIRHEKRAPKHTPGPWMEDKDRVADMGTQADQIREGDWVAIGICDEDGLSEVIALTHPMNAPLVAAAPELLAALQAALASLTDLANDWPVMELHEPISETIERARAVLASIQQSA